MPTLADAAATVLAAGVPVLFLDTCSILDVIRAPARGLVNCVESATQLHALAVASPPRCSLVVGSFVPVEWADHEQDDRHNDTVSRAYDRVAVTKRRPCRKGGELKDCTIFEECLEVCRLLQAGGFRRNMVFCTSNTEDYCAPDFIPHPDVDTDCTAVGLVFTTRLDWALSELMA